MSNQPGEFVVISEPRRPMEDIVDAPPPKVAAPEIYSPKTVDNYRPEEDLLDARRMRAAVVTALTQGGIPVGDKSQMALLLMAIKDQDQQSLGIIRAKVESGEAEANAELRKAGAAMLDAAREARSRGGQVVIDVVPREIPKLDASSLPIEDQREFVDGELATGVSPETFESFTRKHKDVKLAETEEEDD